MSEQDTQKNGCISSDPVALANLAMQFLLPRLAEIQNPDSPLTPVLHDRLYADALKQAGRLLEMAVLSDDPDVHAYQIFKPNAEPISFGAIKIQLESAGWPFAENTLKKYAFEIIENAHYEIEKRMEEIEGFVGCPVGSKMDWNEITDGILVSLRQLQRSTSLKLLPFSAENVCNKWVNCLIEEADKSQLREGPAGLERAHAFSAYMTFVKYVCGGDSYQKFMKSDTREKTSKSAGATKDKRTGAIIKVRPYELFLSAHQNGVLAKELTTKRSRLKPEFLPGPEWPYAFSILSEHEGTPVRDEE
jgi:hypothetical protein